MSDTNTTAASNAKSTAVLEPEIMTPEVIEPTAIVKAELADDGTHFPNQAEGELLTTIDESKEATAIATVEEDCFIPVQSIPASMAVLYQQRHTIRFGPDNSKLSKDKTNNERVHAKRFVMWVKPSTDKSATFRPMMNQQCEPQDWLYDCHISDIRVINIVDPAGNSYDYHKVEIDIDQVSQAFTITASVGSQSALSMLPALNEMANSDHPLGLKQRFHLKASTSNKTTQQALESVKAIPVYVALQDPDRPLYRNDFESYKASFFKDQETQSYLDSCRRQIAKLREEKAKRIAIDQEIDQMTDWSLQEYTSLMNKIRQMPEPEVDVIPVAQNIKALA